MNHKDLPKNVGPFSLQFGRPKIKDKENGKQRQGKWKRNLGLHSGWCQMRTCEHNFVRDHNVHCFVKSWVAECLCNWNGLVTVYCLEVGMANLWKIN